jgi:phosphoenolpyruvate carboxylase
MSRKIPVTMASQHPDHAGVPFWNQEESITTQDEINELFLNYSELGIDEYMWDWEGKLVDEAVIEKLFAKHLDYFRSNQLGQGKFLTFRLPNPMVETEMRLGRAFMGLLSAASLTTKIGLKTPPLFEVILPMCETAKSMIDIQEAFRELAGLKHWLFNTQRSNLEHIEIIPLVEQIDNISRSDEILAEFVKTHEDKFGYKPSYLRPMIARSDPSLNSGHIPTVLSVKVALSKYAKFEEAQGVSVYPIIGCGSLLFRGGLNPYSVKDFCEEYEGVKTVTIQSGFRYDYPLPEVKKAIEELHQILPFGEAKEISKTEEKVIIYISDILEGYYRPTVEKIAPTINLIAKNFPKRRERVQHVGLFGYSRGVGKVKLPRAIGFTGSLYSIGIPPEIIGSGRGIKELMKIGKIDDLKKFYLNLEKDYNQVLRFVNRDNLLKLTKKDDSWKEVLADLEGIEDLLGLQAGPVTEEEKEHQEITGKILDKLESDTPEISSLISKSGKLRRSLG